MLGLMWIRAREGMIGGGLLGRGVESELVALFFSFFFSIFLSVFCFFFLLSNFSNLRFGFS